jgi:hypothetical protein
LGANLLRRSDQVNSRGKHLQRRVERGSRRIAIYHNRRITKIRTAASHATCHISRRQRASRCRVCAFRSRTGGRTAAGSMDCSVQLHGVTDEGQTCVRVRYRKKPSSPDRAGRRRRHCARSRRSMAFQATRAGRRGAAEGVGARNPAHLMRPAGIHESSRRCGPVVGCSGARFWSGGVGLVVEQLDRGRGVAGVCCNAPRIAEARQRRAAG